MIDSQVLAFAGVAVVLSLSPGPAKSALLAAVFLAIGLTWLIVYIR